MLFLISNLLCYGARLSCSLIRGWKGKPPRNAIHRNIALLLYNVFFVIQWTLCFCFQRVCICLFILFELVHVYLCILESVNSAVTATVFTSGSNCGSQPDNSAHCGRRASPPVQLIHWNNFLVSWETCLNLFSFAVYKSLGLGPKEKHEATNFGFAKVKEIPWHVDLIYDSLITWNGCDSLIICQALDGFLLMITQVREDVLVIKAIKHNLKSKLIVT